MNSKAFSTSYLDNLFPHSILTACEPSESEEWCIEKFGSRWSGISNRDGVWAVFWKVRKVGVDRVPGERDIWQYFFKREEDAALFVLKWS